MFQTSQKFIKQKIRGIQKQKNKYFKPRKISVSWIKKEDDSWLAKEFTRRNIRPSMSLYSKKIESLASKTNSSGPQKLWEGYGKNNRLGSTRMPNGVRTAANMGDLFTALVISRKPEFLVEFGTAFGVSGMYFLAGVESNKKGKLLTFEPNHTWAKIAECNLSQISNRFELIFGTFEENIGDCLPQNCCIDMAFIDAIHTREFVAPQLEIVIEKACGGAIIILDDISFSGDMREFWNDISLEPRFSSVLALGTRVGILELKK